MSTASPHNKMSARRLLFPGFTIAGLGRRLSGDVVLSERVRLQTLVLVRWLAVAGQTAAVFGVRFGLGYDLPLLACLVVIGASAGFNLAWMVRTPSATRLDVRQTTVHLGFDLLQLSALLYLTGGLHNPFTLLLLAPITTAATVLSLRRTIFLGLLGLALITFLAFFHEPLPWSTAEGLKLDPLYIGGIWGALAFAILFHTAYAWRVSRESDRMRAALAATQQVLAREQRLAALGGLAAAAAHELGTPLATIALVSKEMSRDFPADSPHHDDVTLLREQADRCREILSRLSRAPGDDDAMLAEMPLHQVLEDIAAPHRDLGVDVEVIVRPADNAELPEPGMMRRPEILYGLGNLVENAADFAREHVEIQAEWSASAITVRITDDGPGFAPDMMERLGEPYVTTRRPRDGQDAGSLSHEAEGQHGMGLGFFIAKTLLERTGASLTIANAGLGARTSRLGGAIVTIQWPVSAVSS